MTKITATQLVWLRDVSHEAKTSFDVVEEPKAVTDIDPATAAAWVRNGWAEEGGGPSPALRAPSPQRGEGKKD